MQVGNVVTLSFYAIKMKDEYAIVQWGCKSSSSNINTCSWANQWKLIRKYRKANPRSFGGIYKKDVSTILAFLYNVV